MVARIFYPQPLSKNSIVILDPAASHHLLSVLRLKEGEPLQVFNGEGGSFSARLDGRRKKLAVIQIHEFDPSETESPLSIHLGQVISRAERMDFTIQKSVELGVNEITPLISERCGVRLKEQRLENRLEHWSKIAISASEQSGRCRVPKINKVVDFTAFLEQSIEIGFICDPMAKYVLPETTQPMQRLTLIIGPEGGFSEQEINHAKKTGVQPLWLGPRILRTETAAIAAMTLLQRQWGDLAVDF
ncbi:MAG: 16S rRNA (uracil(1498)-N(3))-methyltransferase [Proteobacteria bacterium]|nr:16S rRNA (uracil(1498)-N(3))-methyltransferase [Pseudomonadota bacterium]